MWSFPLLIPSTIQLAKSKVTNLLEGGKEVWLPWVYLYAAGFSCVSLSTLNPNSSQNRGSVRHERETSGVSFAQVFAFMPLLRPFIVILENLEKLLEVKDGKSDAAYCVGKFEKAGYCVRWFRLSARDGGSLCARVRLYLVGYKGENQEHRLDFVEQTLQDMQVKASKIGIHLEHFTTTDFDTLIEDEDPGEEKIAALRLWDEDPDTAGQAEEEPLQWCVDQQLVFDALDEAWPPVFSEGDKFAEAFAKQQPRVRDQAYVLAKHWPDYIPDPDLVDESGKILEFGSNFLDLHHAIKFYVPIKDGVVKMTPGIKPWSGFPPTITAGSIVMSCHVMSYHVISDQQTTGAVMLQRTVISKPKDGAKWTVDNYSYRIMHGLELLSLQGWDHQRWQGKKYPEAGTNARSCHVMSCHVM